MAADQAARKAADELAAAQQVVAQKTAALHAASKQATTAAETAKLDGQIAELKKTLDQITAE